MGMKWDARWKKVGDQESGFGHDKRETPYEVSRREGQKLRMKFRCKNVGRKKARRNEFWGSRKFIISWKLQQLSIMKKKATSKGPERVEQRVRKKVRRV